MNWLLKSSIAKKLFSGFIAVLIPMTLVGLLVNYISIDIVKKEVTKSYTNSFTLLSENFKASLNRLKSIAASIATDTDLNGLNQSPEYETRLMEYYNLVRQLQVYSYIGEMESNITVFFLNKNRVYSSKYGVSPISELDRTVLLEDPSKKNGKWQFIQIPMSSNEASLCLLQDAFYNDPSKGLTVLIDINLRKVNAMLNNLQVLNGENAFIIDSRGEMISASPLTVDVDFIKQKSRETQGFSQVDYRGENGNYKVILSKLENTGIVFGMYFQETEYMKSIFTMQKLLYVILVTSLAAAVLFTFFTYRSLLLPVHRLVDAMHHVKSGDLKVRIPESNNEELGFIFNQFNDMAGQLDYLVNEVYDQKLNLEQSKLKLLQSQINPHFLYNCLNFIYRMAQEENMEGVSNMSLYLGRYFRFSTRMDRDMTTIREEVDNIRTYIHIQDMRYPGKITFKDAVEEGLDNLPIPRLLIQPVVENVLVHGFEKLGIPIAVFVHVSRNGKTVVIAVEDNGRGVHEEELQQLNEKIKGMDNTSSSFGLSNIYWRLRLKYGDASDLWLEQREPRGLRVMMQIPVNADCKGETDV